MTWDADGWHDLNPDDLMRWRASYKCDVDAELLKMDNWLRANPRKRKKNWARFATNWLAKAKPEPRKAQTFALSTAQQPEVLTFE